MIRALILAAIVALVVSAAPIASAGSSKKPPPRGIDVASSEVFELNTVKARRPAGHGIIAVLIGAKAAGQPSGDSFAKVPHPRSVTDGTSNTVMFGE